MSGVRAIVAALSSFWSRGQPVERSGYAIGALLISSGLIHLAILIITGASWDGPLSLRKAATFGLSFGLTLITMTWVTSFLRLSKGARAIQLGVFTVACVMETALVSLQAWRGVPSHFNTETSFDALVARALAAGGLTLVVLILAWTVAAFREHASVPLSLLVAIRIGFVTLVAAVVAGVLMIAKGMALVLAGDPQGAYAAGGTLKPTHAVTLHAILVLPALAWLLSFTNWSEQRRLHVVLFGSAGYTALAATIAAGNIADLGLMSPAVVAGVSFGTLLLVVTAFLVIQRVAHGPNPDGIQHR
jgi:hypothetical protein